MEITFSINNRKVEKAVFKTFSSQCEKWIHIISEKKEQIESAQGKMNLTYYPAWNIVVPVAKPSVLLNTLLEAHPAERHSTVERLVNAVKNKIQFLRIPNSVSSLEKI